MSSFQKALTQEAVWEQKDEFLDVIYWMRQVIGLITGLLWAIIPLKGAMAIGIFFIINCGAVYLYCSTFQRVDEDEYGGYGEILKEGLMTAFATYMICWVILYDALYGHTL